MEPGWNKNNQQIQTASFIRFSIPLTIWIKYDNIFKYVFDCSNPAHAVTAPIGYISADFYGDLPPRLGESET
ncbi:hypothetical protein BSK56_29870 [Paenibacillus borealis]|uniref:Uncharacterized protein n=1 Tax=Paenibacillus borealis TaxID=160799 RepID=A0ABX3GW82_PAEBO|nr:hypothetical protein BSK56_29870 [Paenibacillus borealis]